MEKHELEELLLCRTRKEIVEDYGISQSTLSRLIKKYDLGKKGYGSRKLDFDTAQEIRKAYKVEECTQKELAKMFNVSQPTIHKILSNQVYRTNSPRITGEADVKVSYKY